ncbi:MAG: Wadjet anti-phage system protein JetA family protein, partial [Tepidiformaceae bacterium]
MGDTPALFTRVPVGLFGALSGGHATLYWTILATYYHHEFEREPFFLLRTIAVDTAEELIRESPLWRERRQELLEPPQTTTASDAADEATLLRDAARRVVARLESAGWFHFEYRSGVGEVLNFYPYAARILDTLVRVARDEQPLFQGYAHSIASLLRPDVFAARPGVSLSEAKRHTLDLVRELKILNRNIYASTQRLLDEAATAAGVLEESLERYRRAVMANYHRLKTVDNLYKWRGEILQRLDVIESDARAIEAAVRWYAEQSGLDGVTAAAQVREDLTLLRMQFDTLPQVTDDIDARNARFSGVALRKLMYLLRQDTRTEG